MTETTEPIIIDSGTCTMKAGFAGNCAPTVEFPTVIGEWNKEATDTTGKPQMKRFVGEDANARSNLNLKFPIKQGLVNDWDLIEHLWKHTFEKELVVSPIGRTVMVTEPPVGPRQHREKMTQIMFETFSAGALSIVNHCAMTLFSTGKDSGVVLDSGGDMTHAMVVYEGYSLSQSWKRVETAGRQVTDQLENLLNGKGHLFNGNEKVFVRDMKEKFALIRTDLNEEKQISELQPGEFDPEEKTYQLPDGQDIKLSKERYLAPEILFRDERSVQNLVYYSIMNMDADIRKELFGNIVVGGGNSQISGFN
jgi:actin